MFKFDYEIIKKLRPIVEPAESTTKPLYDHILKLTFKEIPDENILLSYGSVGFIGLKNPTDINQKYQLVDSYRGNKCNYFKLDEEIELVLEKQAHAEDIIMNLQAGFQRYKFSADSSELETTGILVLFEEPWFSNIIQNFLLYKTEILSNTVSKIREGYLDRITTYEKSQINEVEFLLPKGDTERLFEKDFAIKRFTSLEYIPNTEGEITVKKETIEI